LNLLDFADIKVKKDPKEVEEKKLVFKKSKELGKAKNRL